MGVPNAPNSRDSSPHRRRATHARARVAAPRRADRVEIRAVGARRREDLDAGSTSRAPAISRRRSVAPDARRTLEANRRETTAAARRKARGGRAGETRYGATRG